MKIIIRHKRPFLKASLDALGSEGVAMLALKVDNDCPMGVVSQRQYFWLKVATRAGF